MSTGRGMILRLFPTEREITVSEKVYEKNPVASTLVRMLVILTAMVGFVAGGIAVAPASEADVFDSCTHKGCAEAAESNSIWSSMGYPSNRGWHDWPDGQCNFSGGTYNNYEGELPDGHSYLEFDVTPRACDASRQSYRLIVDRTDGTVYFSPDHYGNFYRM